MDNKVRELRKAAQMTQATLAEAANTSQQQIQRIESGAQTVRLDVAQAIANALKAPLAKVFPAEEPPIDESLKDFPDFQRTVSRIFKDRANRRFDDTGLVHRILVSLRGGHSLEFPVGAVDIDRLQKLLLDETAQLPYLVFDSHTHLIAINRRHITRAQTLFDRVDPSTDVESLATSANTTSRLDDAGLVALMATEQVPVKIDVGPDNGDLESDPPGQLAQLFYELEFENLDSGFCSIQDIDGESALFAVDDLAAIAVHHQWVAGNFDVWNEDDEGEQEKLASDA